MGGKMGGGRIGQASGLSSTVNLLNTIVGAGVLTMPLAISRMGIVLGTLMILWSAVTAGFGLYLQARCTQYLERGSASFFALSQITYPNAAVIFDAAIAVKCFGVAISYLIIIGDLMPGVVAGFAPPEHLAPVLLDRHFWITAFMLVVIPLSFLRRLDSLKYTSLVSLISVGYLVILVLYHFCAGDTPHSGSDSIRLIEWAGAVPALSAVPVIVFAYTCHQNMFSVLNEITDNSHSTTTAVILASNGSAAAIYILVGLAGYLSFGNEIGGNIIAQYAPSLLATLGRAAIVVLVMFSYPLQVHPCRASVDAVWKWRPSSSATDGPSKSRPTSPPRNIPLLPASSASQRRGQDSFISNTRFAVITTVIIILSYFVSITVQSLEAVLAYVGSTGSTSISFILPGLFFYKISSPDSPQHQRLVKQEDDYDDGDGEADEQGLIGAAGRIDHDSEEGLLNSGLLNASTLSLKALSSKTRRRRLLRKLSAALAGYGVLVMVSCLITNTFFIVTD